MNIQQAKQLPLPNLLERLGFQPVKSAKGGRELWYCSPFREEKEPSFHISIGRLGFWIWKDFGDIGGTVIDFVMRYKEFNSVSETLSFLDSFYPNHFVKSSTKPSESFFFHPLKIPARQDLEAEEKQLVFLHAEPIKNPVIISYLEKERAIPFEIAKEYLQEVHYQNTTNQKKYFALGMKNKSGGYEIRSASNQLVFKSVLIQRDITLIHGRNKGRKQIHIFEGMIDFLSYLVMKQRETPIHDCLILHSLSSFGNAIEYIQSKGYADIYSYLDNDKTGKECTEKLNGFSELNHYPQNELYQGFRDINDALVYHQSQSKQR